MVFRSVRRVYFREGVGKVHHQQFRVLQREPNVFVVFRRLGMLVMLVLMFFGMLMVLMFVFFGFFTMFMVVFLFGLHAFYDFFFFDAVTQSFHQVHLNAAFLRRCFQRFLDPFVGFTTYVHYHVGACASRRSPRTFFSQSYCG